MGKWVKEMPEDYYNHRSFFEDDVMLWMNKNVYVMDNHRDAAWCSYARGTGQWHQLKLRV